MVPLDEDTVAIVDRIVEVRSPGLALPHPRHGRRVEFLLTHPASGSPTTPSGASSSARPPEPASARSCRTS